MKKILKKHAEKLRFVIVGGLSTVIDFGILFIAVAFGIPVVVSNFISTSIASIFNFFAHKTFTYSVQDKTNTKHVVSYLAVTLSGLWILQPSVITICIKVLTGDWSTTNQLAILIAKILATVASTLWSYYLYRKFVFIK